MSLAQKEFAFRDIFKRAYQLARHNKLLWFFGFFAAFLGVGGELEALFQNYTSVTNTTTGILSWKSIYQDGLFIATFNNIRDFFGAYPVQGFLFILLLLVVAIVLIWLAIVSQIALFDSAKKLNANKKVTYADAYRVGNTYFGKVLGVTFLLRALQYVLFAIIGSILVTWFLGANSVAGGIAFVLFIFIILIPVSVIVSFMLRYAVAYIVLKDKPAMESIRLAWQLFAKNWIISIEMAVLVLALGVLAGLIIAIAIGLASVPFILIAIAAMFFGSTGGFAVAFALMTVSWFLVSAIIGAMYVGFQYTAWTMFFLELDKNRADSRVIRVLNKIGIGVS